MGTDKPLKCRDAVLFSQTWSRERNVNGSPLAKSSKLSHQSCPYARPPVSSLTQAIYYTAR